MSVIIFVLLGSEDNFSYHYDPKTLKTPSMVNGLYSTIAFILGGLTSIASGYLGMTIATFANARVAVEARKGIAPAFECGACPFYPLDPPWTWLCPKCSDGPQRLVITSGLAHTRVQ